MLSNKWVEKHKIFFIFRVLRVPSCWRVSFLLPGDQVEVPLTVGALRDRTFSALTAPHCPHVNYWGQRAERPEWGSRSPAPGVWGAGTAELTQDTASNTSARARGAWTGATSKGFRLMLCVCTRVCMCNAGLNTTEFTDMNTSSSNLASTF